MADPGEVAAEPAHGDRPRLPWEVRYVALDLGVEIEPPLLVQPRRGHRRQRLRDASDAELRLSADTDTALAVGEAACLRPDHFASGGDGRGQTRGAAGAR